MNTALMNSQRTATLFTTRLYTVGSIIPTNAPVITTDNTTSQPTNITHTTATPAPIAPTSNTVSSGCTRISMSMISGNSIMYLLLISIPALLYYII